MPLRLRAALLPCLLLLALLLGGCNDAGNRMAGAVPTAATPAPSGARLAMLPAAAQPAPPVVEEARFANAAENGFTSTAEAPVSTFSLHSDTASYNVVRRLVRDGVRPPPGVVRAAEFINAFRYEYPAAPDSNQPFSSLVSVHPAPWNAERQLLHIGIRTHAVPKAERPPLNLVFLVDASGSMASPDRLPLVKRAIRMMLPQLGARDHVALVSYAGDAVIEQAPVPGNQLASFEQALDRLVAGGATYGEGGIVRA